MRCRLIGKLCFVAFSRVLYWGHGIMSLLSGLTSGLLKGRSKDMASGVLTIHAIPKQVRHPGPRH